MTLPTTTASTTEQSGALPGATFYEERTRSGQKPPYDLALPYRVYRRSHSSVTVTGSHPWIQGMTGFAAYGSQGNEETWAYRHTHAFPTGLIADAQNRARKKALQAIGDTAGWAENLAEYKQAMGMMSSRLWILGRAFAQLRAGNLPGALKALNISADQLKKNGVPWSKMNARYVSRHAASLWMELHFGWSPLLNDIWTSIQILSEKPEGGSVSKGARAYGTETYYAPGNDYTGLPHFRGKHKVEAWARVSFRWEVVNPNLYLANRMGLVNPATLLWNLAPLSWFADWIVDVSSWLNQWTDLLGLKLSEPCYTVGFKDACDSHVWCVYADQNWYTYKSTTQSMYCRRILGFPDATLRAHNPFYRISPARGFTAISYLIQKGIKATA